MTRSYDEPPERLTWYHLPSLLAAGDGRLKYNPAKYPIHGVSNNAVSLIWCGLLADAPEGPVLTDLGRRMLDEWKETPDGRRYTAAWADDAELEPMTEEAAAWVRANAWTPAMRREWAAYPDRHAKCPCEWGLSARCEHGEHRKCDTSGLPFPECYITTKDDYVLMFPTPYEHPTTTATGEHVARAAQVWLADRICRWRCPCSCGHLAGRAPLPPPKAQRMMWLGEPVEQEALF